jgi:lipopolysaccharide export system permease protein
MRTSITLSRYLIRQFSISLGVVSAVLLGVVILFDAVEIMRRIPEEWFSIGRVLEFVLLKLPYTMQTLSPFIILIASMLTHIRMTRSSELIILRSAGVSAWHFLLPNVAFAIFLGLIFLSIINPISAVMMSRFEKLEAHILQGQTNLLAISSTGLWLRQNNGADEGRAVIHALRVDQEKMELQDIMFLLLDEKNSFIERIDAPRARLESGYWRIEDAWLSRPSAVSIHKDVIEFPTKLSAQHIQDSFASPQTLGFWELPGFISMLKRAGFSALRHRLYFQELLAMPILFAAMIYVGAAFSLHLPRQGKSGLLMSGGIITGLGFKFLNDIVHALGLTGRMPIWFSAWSAVWILLLLGMVFVLHREDG